MFKQFALCLGPALLAYLLTVVMTLTEDRGTFMTDSVFGFIIVLIIAGAIISGVCVARKVFRRSHGGEGLRWFLTILTFLGVGIAYLAIGFAGCCGVAAFSEMY